MLSSTASSSPCSAALAACARARDPHAGTAEACGQMARARARGCCFDDNWCYERVLL